MRNLVVEALEAGVAREHTAEARRGPSSESGLQGERVTTRVVHDCRQGQN